MAVPDNWLTQLHDFIYVKEEEGSDAEAECILRLLRLRLGRPGARCPSARTHRRASDARRLPGDRGGYQPPTI